MAPLQQLGEVNWSVVCAACCRKALVFAVMHSCNIFLIASVHCFLYNSVKSDIDIDKSTEWSTIPVCPSLACFFFKQGQYQRD